MGTHTTTSVRTNIPSRDAQMCDWFANVARCIAADPARYRLTPGDAAKLTQHADAYDRAYHRANQPGTRTKPTIEAKNEVKAAALTVFREYANRIARDASIDTADKVALGMKPSKPARPTVALRFAPILNVTIAPGKAGVEGAHRVRFVDSHAPRRRAKPEGAGHLELRIIIAPGSVGPIFDPDIPASDDVTVRTEKLTRNPSTITHGSAPGNHTGPRAMTATYFGRWSTKSKKNPITSPWSLPVAMTVVAGGRIEP